jgi:hypothetical protein
MRPDGRVEMRVETTGRKELVWWMLSWMPDLKVLVPKSLRDRRLSNHKETGPGISIAVMATERTLAAVSCMSQNS